MKALFCPSKGQGNRRASTIKEINTVNSDYISIALNSRPPQVTTVVKIRNRSKGFNKE